MIVSRKLKWAILWSPREGVWHVHSTFSTRASAREHRINMPHYYSRKAKTRVAKIEQITREMV